MNATLMAAAKPWRLIQLMAGFTISVVVIMLIKRLEQENGRNLRVLHHIRRKSINAISLVADFLCTTMAVVASLTTAAVHMQWNIDLCKTKWDMFSLDMLRQDLLWLLQLPLPLQCVETLQLEYVPSEQNAASHTTLTELF